VQARRLKRARERGEGNKREREREREKERIVWILPAVSTAFWLKATADAVGGDE